MKKSQKNKFNMFLNVVIFSGLYFNHFHKIMASDKISGVSYSVFSFRNLITTKNVSLNYKKQHIFGKCQKLKLRCIQTYRGDLARG